ncbi:peptidoglycan glycosyltransferase [Nautilia profundicola AmH]|uniref:Peptidoglycan glycosyltransferase n=1 Tax=Nautilia profundicola (strain ATCC BAA-1463 / DSM 18972 / AmH) TaxID=598659 RepID=B9LAC7_NAUPA|nr:penicillin-binding protein 2 [Nautilia profundicola]ACM93375.1 peptidoglycan glycosyltransferase [Nautilia profundicola AmH]
MRTKIVLSIILVFYAVLIYRVYDLSVKSNEKYKKLSLQNRQKEILIAPVRGVIYDRKGNPVAYNELRFDIALKPHLKKEDLIEAVQELTDTLNDINASKILQIYNKENSPYNHKPIVLLKYLNEDVIYKIQPFLSLNNNIIITPSYLRKYPYKDILSNVLGYVSKANVKDLQRNKTIELTQISGKRGIEKYYDDILQGEPGKKDVIVNAKNEILKEVSFTKPKSHTLTLSIDTTLQKYIYNLLKKENKKGAVVVMKTNGEILALVTYPSFDNNLFVKGIDFNTWNKLIHDIYNPLLNKPVSGIYPPGSTVKPAEGLIAAASRKWNPWKKIYCPGFLEIGNRKFRDWKVGGHGEVDLIKAIKRSVDVYYYKIGLRLGIDYIAKNLRKMGFGEKTGIDLPNEKKGIVPDKEWKIKRYHQPWFIGETLNAVIGQGYFLATPLQVAVNTALLASGKLPKPYIVKKIDSNVTKPVLKDVLTKKEKSYLGLVRRGMWAVCNAPGGTATNYLNTKVTIAGKTGTAQVYSIPQEVKKRKREDELKYFHRSHAWLTTYGPYRRPQVVVTVLIEHGGHGGHAAGGIVSRIYDYLVDNGYIKLR